MLIKVLTRLLRLRRQQHRLASQTYKLSLRMFVSIHHRKLNQTVEVYISWKNQKMLYFLLKFDFKILIHYFRLI